MSDAVAFVLRLLAFVVWVVLALRYVRVTESFAARLVALLLVGGLAVTVVGALATLGIVSPGVGRFSYSAFATAALIAGVAFYGEVRRGK